MNMIDRLEKLGRLVLWLSLAATCIAALVTYVSVVRRASEVAAKLEQTQKDLDEAMKPKPPDPIPRLTLESMGASMHSLNTRNATGRVYFSNVSARKGVVCAIATVASPTGGRTTSLPSCIEVMPYASGLQIEVPFAGRDLEAVCKAGDCEIDIVNKNDDAAAPTQVPEPPQAAPAAPAAPTAGASSPTR